MYLCRHCSEPAISYSLKHKMTVCGTCAEALPEKVYQRKFEQTFFGPSEWIDILPAIRREFYLDYLHSPYTLAEYCKNTSIVPDIVVVEIVIDPVPLLLSRLLIGLAEMAAEENDA